MTYLDESRRNLMKLLAMAALLAACGAGGGQGSQGTEVAVEQQQGLMARWNTVAAGVTAEGGFHFRWDSFDQFPHPTFKGGSIDAYRRFADILVALYEKDDNFQYLSDNRLFRATLRFVAPTGSSAPAVETTFETMTSILLSDNWLAPGETQRKLEEFQARIRMAP
jgi:hypothetical protein